MADDGGTSRFARKMRSVSAAMGTLTVEKVLVKQAGEMASTMRALVPVDSGDAKESIAVTLAGQSTPPYSQPGGSMVVPENAVAITVGDSEVRYPHLIEYGTTKSQAQPFFWPAVRMHNRKAKRAIKNAIGRAARKVWSE